MSESQADVFDEKFSVFARWQTSPWGRLRYTTAAANLTAHLSAGPLDILDVGGGNGLDALELAARGHHVTIADISEQSLAEAYRGRARGLDDRVTTRHASIDALGDEFGRGCFDVLLCHNLIQYLPDPAGVIATLAVPLRVSGVLSVIAPNADADPLLSAVRGLDPGGALGMLDAPTRYSVAYETTTRACYPNHVKADLATAGFEVIAHRGIRTVCDYIVDDDRKSDPEFYRQLERLELALAARVPYIHLARFSTPPSAHRCGILRALHCY
ncbi:methyltransferase domain-containing protein [Nocardia sp. NPDC051911]|uniref:class I SAM-dependent methyltransferase n=1 Tax=Nocardia sp. NPDC051911 TaxID=3154648 RepID=UPI00341B585D